ncbi:MAG: hypothetical protein IPM58_02750 [Nitrospira sp.]|nr:hypothetical protein [Nitrospira sp.]
MATLNPGRDSRQSRVANHYPGVSGTSSQDFSHLAKLLFQTSAEYAKNADGNCSIYTLAGIPILFSALHCLLIELNAGMWANSHFDKTTLVELAKSGNDVSVIAKCYPTFPDKLRQKLDLLIQVRHEILHPAHRPGPEEKNNTPEYLVSLREAGLLQSTGNDVDYIWLSQLQSHRLFRWAFNIVRDTVDTLLRLHDFHADMTAGILQSYSTDETIDASL